MAEAIRIRARQRGEITDVLLLAPHVMETGLRKDSAGRAVPAHFISRLQIHVGTRLVLQADTSHAMAADPMLALRLRHAPAGEILRVTWIDNRGEQRSDEALIT